MSQQRAVARQRQILTFPTAAEASPPCESEEPTEQVPQQRTVSRKKQGERNAQFLIGTAAGVLALGVLLGVGNMVREAQNWRVDLGRDKAPWERAMGDFERSL